MLQESLRPSCRSASAGDVPVARRKQPEPPLRGELLRRICRPTPEDLEQERSVGGIENVIAIVREVRTILDEYGPLVETGAKIRERPRGGREDPERDKRMAREFLRQRPPGSNPGKKSPTALKKEIGKAEGLKRSAAIEAVDRGLKLLKSERK